MVLPLCFRNDFSVTVNQTVTTIFIHPCQTIGEFIGSFILRLNYNASLQVNVTIEMVFFYGCQTFTEVADSIPLSKLANDIALNIIQSIVIIFFYPYNFSVKYIKILPIRRNNYSAIMIY